MWWRTQLVLLVDNRVDLPLSILSYFHYWDYSERWDESEQWYNQHIHLSLFILTTRSFSLGPNLNEVVRWAGPGGGIDLWSPKRGRGGGNITEWDDAASVVWASCNDHSVTVDRLIDGWRHGHETTLADGGVTVGGRGRVRYLNEVREAVYRLF